MPHIFGNSSLHYLIINEVIHVKTHPRYSTYKISLVFSDIAIALTYQGLRLIKNEK